METLKEGAVEACPRPGGVILLRFGRRVDHGLGVNDHVQVLQESRQGAVVVRERPPNKAEVFVHRTEGGYRQAHLHHTLGLRVPELTETDHQVVDLLPQRRSYGRTGVRDQHAQRCDEFSSHVLAMASMFWKSLPLHGSSACGMDQRPKPCAQSSSLRSVSAGDLSMTWWSCWNV